ncbi:MAG: class I SAM-dependent methyltransferase [Candidatus Diapherotrites archaeon]
MKNLNKEKEVEVFYDQLSTKYEVEHSKRVCDEILEYFLLKFLPKKTKLKIMDAGGGVGRFSFPLAKNGNEIVLTDISEGMLSEARRIATKNKLQNITFLKESIIDMRNQKNNSFDVVLVMNAILDYCGNHKQALKEIFRILKPNGVLIGNVNNRFIYSTMHELKEGSIEEFERVARTGDRYIRWGEAKTGHHTHEFTLEELKSDFSEAGFEMIHVLGIFNLLGKYANPEWLSDPKKRKKYLELQIKYAQKEEYINNSWDFFFIAKKPAHSL